MSSTHEELRWVTVKSLPLYVFTAHRCHRKYMGPLVGAHDVRDYRPLTLIVLRGDTVNEHVQRNITRLPLRNGKMDGIEKPSKSKGGNIRRGPSQLGSAKKIDAITFERDKFE
ncbi:hypothetical protein Trydic_g17209 [Trypoxylus dichotomus]